ncbi:MAG: hypothetical protein AAGE59_14845 [Cyanobacteria bacterium P01_F01_bin.86]
MHKFGRAQYLPDVYVLMLSSVPQSYETDYENAIALLRHRCGCDRTGGTSVHDSCRDLEGIR